MESVLSFFIVLSSLEKRCDKIVPQKTIISQVFEHMRPFDPSKPFNHLPLLPPKKEVETRAVLNFVSKLEQRWRS